MRQSFALRSLAGTALALLLSVSQAPMAVAAATSPAQETESFDIESVDSFAGAFLAARTAETDRDYGNAVKLYKKALEFTPNELELQQRLMIALIMNGQFDEGADLAKVLEKDPAVERVTSVALGFRAIRDGNYSEATRLVQYADMVAYALWRAYEHGDHQFLDLIKDRFDRAGEVVHGLHTVLLPSTGQT